MGCTASKTNETELRKLRDENKLLKEEIQSLNRQSLKEKNQSLKQDEKPSLKDQLRNVSTPSATTSRDGKADASPHRRLRATAPPPPPTHRRRVRRRLPLLRRRLPMHIPLSTAASLSSAAVSASASLFSCRHATLSTSV